MELAEIIGRNLRDYRSKWDYSQDHIASLLGVERSTISHYERAEREISIVHLNKIADLFGIEVEDLLESDTASVKANLAFAFRCEGICEEDVSSIADFQKVVKNYVKMHRIANEQD